MGTQSVGPPKLRRYHLLESVSSRTFTPREYQVELLDAAKNKNTIVCLGTRADKTFIAIMLIKELTCQIQSSHNIYRKRTTVFLVPSTSGSYIHQQMKVIRDYTNLTVIRLVDPEVFKSSDSQATLKNNIREHKVILTTPYIFSLILQRGYLSLPEINLLIFCEYRTCNNEKETYCEIIKYFDACAITDQPRILVLSDFFSLVNSKCHSVKLEQEMNNLELLFDSTVETGSALTMLSKYGPKPKEIIVRYKLYSNNGEDFMNLLKTINSALSFLEDCGQDKIYHYLYQLSNVILLGPWCTLQVTSLFMHELLMKLKSCNSENHKNFIIFLMTIIHQITELCKRILHDSSGSVHHLDNHSPSKLKELLNLFNLFSPKKSEQESTTSCTNSVDKVTISNETSHPKDKRKSCFNHRLFEDTKSLCCLIFVRHRITAYLLNAWLTELSEHDENFKFISSSYITGPNVHGKTISSNSDLVLDVFSHHMYKQEEILRKFKSREFNVIITTSVVEEKGFIFDIPKCNLIIHFDTPEYFSAYLQSKGRARASDSFHAIMVNAEESENFQFLTDFKNIEQILLRKSHIADTTEEVNIKTDLMEPYMPVKEEGAACVTLASALSLVNRYCAKLPSDTFTRLTPNITIEEICISPSEETGWKNILYQCTVQLPINSPLKQPIVGKPMETVQLSKMAAGLKTCEELHKIGELDNNLQPTGKESVRFEGDDSLEDVFEVENFTEVNARPGTTKRRQYYFKQVAETLQGALPVPGKPSFLYQIRMVLTCPIPEEQNTRGRKIHDPASSPRSFGILLNKPIPPISSFPIFTRSGEVTIYIDLVTSELCHTESQLEQLAYFHRYTFSDVLRLEKYPMMFNPPESELSLYVVPLKMHSSIDWKFVESINKLKYIKPRKLTEEERQFFMFEERDYKDAVVMPWYRNLDKPQYYYVAEVCSHLSPLSNFPDAGFQTFKGYYEKKYSIRIVNHTQPLLDVDHTSARLNLLTPRYVNRKGITLPTSSENTKKTKRENLEQKQILIPELCVIHPFPASLWRKAVCLPCILYRMNSLLLAEQLRSIVAKSIFVGIYDLPLDFTWPTLDFGWTLSDVIKAQNTNTSQKTVKEIDQTLPRQSAITCNAEVNSSYFNLEGALMPFEIHDSGENNNFQNDMNSIYEIDDSFISSTDFEIDTFDPNKYVIPDDILLEDAVDDFPAICNQSLDVWKSPSEVKQIRYGSPTHFEDWNNHSHSQSEETNFYSLNLPGLGYISAPEMFNMESLSLDLASQRVNGEINWDSDEKSVSDEDENNVDAYEESDDSDLQDNLEEISPTEMRFYSTDLSDVLDLEEKENLFELYREDKSIYKSNRIPNIEEVESEHSDNSSLSSVKENSSVERHFEKKALSVEKTECKREGCNSTLQFGELLPNRDKSNICACERDIEDKTNKLHIVFDESPDVLSTHPGPSPSIILQALTMSNANDGINLERLETVGDSFLKYAITAYLFCMYPNMHEGKLSFLRSKQISNLNLYRLGKIKGLGELMVASKFEPNDNYLPPCYTVPKGLEEALIESGLPISQFNINNINNLTSMNEEEIREFVLKMENSHQQEDIPDNTLSSAPLIPYNLLTQHSIPDKSIADCVEALIGAYLISVGSRGALLFMSWLGLKVLPVESSTDHKNDGTNFGMLDPPATPLLSHVPDPSEKLGRLLSGYSSFEDKIGYHFRDKSYLLQAFTHASYYYNNLTDCYQRLEFLGDAVLDYLITRHLYEDPKKHSPGTLTDLRSALVNNTFFASLAIKYDFHKYFKAISPSLFHVINKFVELKQHSIENYADHYYIEEDECEEMEDVEVPKALGDIFESVAGALYLDSNMSLDAVWTVYYQMMKPEIEYFSSHVPKSPIRELLELEPQTAKFEKAEMTLSGKVRVKVEIFGKGIFIGIGRNKRIAKCTAAKRALRELKKRT